MTDELNIRLEATDSHWVRLKDPNGVAKEESDWWRNELARGREQPQIIIRIPEVLTNRAKATIRWKSND